MSVKCNEIMRVLEGIAPISLAESWDNVGLQVGDKNKVIKKIMVCLELNNKIIDEAIKKEIDMIITHHPLIFKPLKTLLSSDPIVRIINKLIKNDINLYCAHTNLDIAIGGTSDYLASLLNLSDLKPLSITENKKYYKLAVFVPENSIEDVREAISLAGAGNIGNYSHCTFQSKGVGTFKPLQGADPYIGEINRLEKVDEYRLETIVPGNKLSSVLDDMLKAHPYEEAAYDVIPLENNIESLGIGRIGELATQKTLKDFALEVKNVLSADSVKVIGNEQQAVKKIGICTGSGSEYIKTASRSGCDCYITGDIKYHDAQLASDLGLCIIDAGHYETENIICIPLKDRLLKEFEKNNFAIEVTTSEININPFKVI
ncbi:Nif3-like dinuclear metal center hexameric protein [Wukongibacter baidiensis]|uniref:Nif3-like dinuclear metal center hexameric protein n=1 Tax=Wukongibacter baidiensis TaxID=1723361 RepID=UPI003D7F9072